MEGSALLFWVEVTWGDKHPSGQYNLDRNGGMAGEGGMGVGTGSEGVAGGVWGSAAQTVNAVNHGSHQNAGETSLHRAPFRNKGANSSHANNQCGFLRECLEEEELTAVDP